MTVDEQEPAEPLTHQLGAHIGIQIKQDARLERDRARCVAKVVQHVERPERNSWKNKGITCFTNPIGDALSNQDVRAKGCMAPVWLDTADGYDDRVCIPSFGSQSIEGEQVNPSRSRRGAHVAAST